MIVGIITLGCDKNTVDSEYLAGLLQGYGHEVVVDGSLDEIDIVVIVTCGFILDAREQSLEVMEEVIASKLEKGMPRHVIVAGCLAQRMADDLRAKFPDVDACFGVGHLPELAQLVNQYAEKEAIQPTPLAPPDMAMDKPLPRARLDAWPHAFLKIADGCDHRCAFCAIPAMKGPYRSVPREIILEEARGLVEIGTRELVLIAQDISPYGRDLYDDYNLNHLLEDICRIDGEFRVRLMYFYPSGLTPEFIEVFAREDKICKYLDMPLQHLDPGVLRAMQRPAAEDATREKIARLREAVPDVVLRTTMIVGFPGESNAAFKRLLDGVKELRFDWLGAFEWSPEEGTPAAESPNRVAPRMVERRREKLLKLQEQITAEKLEGLIGQRIRVLVESFEEDGSAAHGRSWREAPEVDGLVIMPLEEEPEYVPENGEFIEVEIEDASDLNLYGRIIIPGGEGA
ncbi:MAG: 30S ribosomal protein S12 methylthiotransferase RimO [Candidatus Sumerlaeia bacterium]